VEAGGSAPVSKEHGKSQPLREIWLSLSRYRLNRLPIPSTGGQDTRNQQGPPCPGDQRGLLPCWFHFRRCTLVIVPQSTGLGGRTRAAAAASEARCSEGTANHTTPMSLRTRAVARSTHPPTSSFPMLPLASAAFAASFVSASSSRRICETRQQGYIGAKECRGD